MFTLKSDLLRIEILEPGEESNNQTRFDRAAYISEVVLNNGMRFCASEPKNLIHPCSGGRGFCNEFRFDVSGEVEVGEYFPKFGVGLIRKEDEGKFIFHKTYKDVKPFPVEISHDDNKAVFVTEPVPCAGYAMRSTKTVTVEGNTMTLITKVENTGEKAIHMEEFCHNFISIDGMAVGSDYELSMPQIPDLGNERLANRRGFSGVMRGNGKGITFCEPTAIDTDFFVDGKDIEPVIPFTWKMTHKGAKAYVEGEDHFVPGKLPVWAVSHMVSPEVVHCFTLEPGETKEWKRVWRFGTL